MCQISANAEGNVEAGIRRCYGKLVRHRFQGSDTLKSGFLRKVRLGKILKRGNRIIHECTAWLKARRWE